MSEKRCSRCHVVKPLEEFHVSRKASDGRRSECKRCLHARTAAWKRKHPDRVREMKASERRKNAGRIAAKQAEYRRKRRGDLAEQLRQWYAADPRRRRAHGLVRMALQRGDIHRPPFCQSCGRIGFVEASHDDYGEPLKVDWLCRSCHKLKDLTLAKNHASASEGA